MILTQIEHRYGPQVHLLHNPFLQGLLARLCAPETYQPQINTLVHTLYNQLLMTAVNSEFPRETFTSDTRMTALHPGQRLTGERVLHDQKAVVVNLARAGTYPSHLCFENLHYVLEPQGLRQDHIFAARTVDGKNKVTGTEIGATKIGGDIEGAMVFFPDPMGATGNTIITAMSHYKNHVPGKAKKMIALHLIVTPEYLRQVLALHPDISIFALRLDRGLSDKAVLETPPGTHWDKERGLDEKGYIVPGAGGFGEIMNNSFV